MTVRLRLALPIGLGLLAAAAFGLAVLAIAFAEGWRGAVLALAVLGAVATVAAAWGGRWLARLIRRSLDAVPSAAAHDPYARRPAPLLIGEIDDVARRLAREASDRARLHEEVVRDRSALDALLDAVSEGILEVDRERRVVRANRAARRLLGLPADAVGRPIDALVRHPVLRRLLAPVPDATPAGGIEVSVEDRRILATAGPAEGGGLVASLVDLTDLRRLEEVRRDFVANASHELKTPLTAIRGYTETLLSDDLPAAERERFLATIARNAARLQGIVDDLLDLSRLESGRWQPSLEVVPIADAAAAAWEPLARRAQDRAITFALDDDAAAAAVLADPRGLEHVFTNLFDNALRHTPDGGRIHVAARPASHPPLPLVESPQPGEPRARAERGERGEPGEPPEREDAAGGWIVVGVADTGGGIPRDALPRIFERFYRVDPARSREEGGTGLGLAIVKHLVETMGGSITAESELRKGTTIRFWLPAPPPRYVDVTTA